jgi:segregation and condensation protein B
MDASEQRRIIEALILASPEPIAISRLVQIVPDLSSGDAKDRINELNTEYAEQDRSFEIWEVAGGFQIRTRAEFSGYLQQLRRERPLRLSKAALETLAVIAYKQPVTRAEIEAVRGVDSGAVAKSLLERRLVRIVGHREVPGRPLLYGTSRRFLEIFGLESIKQLPSLRELEELAREQGIQLPGMGDEPTEAETDGEKGALVGADTGAAPGDEAGRTEAASGEGAAALGEGAAALGETAGLDDAFEPDDPRYVDDESEAWSAGDAAADEWSGDAEDADDDWVPEDDDADDWGEADAEADEIDDFGDADDPDDR